MICMTNMSSTAAQSVEDDVIESDLTSINETEVKFSRMTSEAMLDCPVADVVANVPAIRTRVRVLMAAGQSVSVTERGTLLALYTVSCFIQGFNLKWDATTRQLVQGAFYWGYVPTLFLGGWISVYHSAKRCAAWGLGMASLCTMLTHMMAVYNSAVFITLRVCQGIFAVSWTVNLL